VRQLEKDANQRRKTKDVKSRVEKQDIKPRGEKRQGGGGSNKSSKQAQGEKEELQEALAGEPREAGWKGGHWVHRKQEMGGNGRTNALKTNRQHTRESANQPGSAIKVPSRGRLYQKDLRRSKKKNHWPHRNGKINLRHLK